MPGRRILQFIVFVAAAVLLTSCVAFRSGDLTLTPWPPKATGNKRSVKIAIDGVSGHQLESFYKQTIAAYQDSGLFSKILTSSQAERSEIIADIRVIHRGEGSQALATISGLTLGLIPAWAQDSIEVRTNFKQAGGEILGSTKQSQSVRLWIHTTLIFLSPFFPLQAQLDATMYDLGRASLIEIADVGALAK
jgi:hypothetical protein